VALGSAQWNGWGRGIENTRYQPEPAIRATDVSRLALKWAFGYPGASSVSGQPTIADGRVFVASAGHVYALDAKSGCTYWRYDIDAHAFTAIAIAELGAQRPIAKPRKLKRGRIDAHLDVLKPPSAAFIGDDKGGVYALDAERGTLLWKTQLETQPSARIQGAPTVYQNRLYVAVARASPMPRAMRATPAAPSAEASRRWTSPRAALRGKPIWWARSRGRPQAPMACSNSVLRGLRLPVPLRSMARAVSSMSPRETPSIPHCNRWRMRSWRWISPTARCAGRSSSSPRCRGFRRGLHARVHRLADLAPLAGGRQLLLAGQRSGLVYGLDPERSGEVLWQLSGAESKNSGESNPAWRRTTTASMSRSRD